MRYAGSTQIVKGENARCVISDYDHIALQVIDGPLDLGIVKAIGDSYKEYSANWKDQEFDILVAIIKPFFASPSPDVRDAMSENFLEFGMRSRVLGVVFYEEGFIATVIRAMMRASFVVNAPKLKGKSVPLKTFSSVSDAVETLSLLRPNSTKVAVDLRKKVQGMANLIL